MGRKATIVFMENLKRKLNRVSIALNDLEQAKKFLDKYLNIVSSSRDDIVIEALLSSIVICYSRPFGKNYGKYNEKVMSENSINCRDYFECSDADNLALHNKIICIRNEAIAHADWQRYPTDSKRTATDIVVIKSKFYNILQDEKIILIIRPLLDELIAKLDKQRVDLYFKIQNYVSESGEV